MQQQLTNSNFNPYRKPIIVPKAGAARMKLANGKSLKADRSGKKKIAPEQNVVCKCEMVTEAEIVEAMHRSLPVDSTQGGAHVMQIYIHIHIYHIHLNAQVSHRHRLQFTVLEAASVLVNCTVYALKRTWLCY